VRGQFLSECGAHLSYPIVQSALARIRRVQEEGKQEVELCQDELDALVKRRKRMGS
jgi:hypothetical protein